MDNANWRGAQSIDATTGTGAVPVMMPENTDWRSQLQPDFRPRIVNKIMETLKRHLPFTGEEGLLELKKIAVSMEEKVYTAAISLSDYLRKISLKMLTMETKSQPPLGNSAQPNTGTNNQNPTDSVSGGIRAQVINQGQQLPIPTMGNQIQARQQLLPQNIQNNITSTGMQNSASLTTASPSAGGMAPASLPSVNGQNSNLQSIQNLSHTGSVHGGDWQEEAYQKIRSMKEMYFVELNEVHQRIASKLELHDIPQQPKNEHLEKLKFFKAMLEKLLQFLRLNKNDIQIAQRDKIGPWEKQIVNILNSNRPRKPVSLQGQQNQQWQSQISQMQPHESQMSSQMQSSINVQGSVMPMQQNNIANLQHNSLSSASNLQYRDGSLDSTAQIGSVHGGDWHYVYQIGTLQRDMQRTLHTSTPLLHHQNFDPQKQLFQPQRQIPDGPSTSLDSTAQTGSIHGGDWQEEAYQKIRSMKDMYFVELNELYQRIASKLELHDIPQQPKNEHLEKLKFFKAMLEKLFQFLRLNKNDIQIAQREKIGPWEKQIVNILNSNRPRKPVSLQGQLSQSHRQTMQQNQQSQSQISQMQPHESQMSSQMQSSINLQGSLDSTAQIGSVHGGDWQEDVYQKIRSMKEMYFAELNGLYQRIETKIQLLGIPQQPKNEHLENLEFFKAMLEKLLQFLSLNKIDIQIAHREKVGPWERQIENILNSNRPQKPVSSQSHMHTMQQNQSQSEIYQMQPMQTNNIANVQHN